MYPSFFTTGEKNKCFGCEACGQACPSSAIEFQKDKEGFRYPTINNAKCVNCGLCAKVCPIDNAFYIKEEKKETFGGYLLNKKERFESTSGGAFTAICKSFFDKDTIIFGAASDVTNVYHVGVESLENISILRKSKYRQSYIGNTYIKIRDFLKQGKKILFSGTPCQVAALNLFLFGTNKENLLTVEVICEGVPSPLFIDKYLKYVEKKKNKKVIELDYRSKQSRSSKQLSKWDFQVEKITFEDGTFTLTDRWLNPFWQLWLRHLMSRPSCYECQFARLERTADITLGDLWGVHIYCPELYGDNGGSSLVVCNTEKGKFYFNLAKKYMFGHELSFEEAVKYQSPLRKHIEYNSDRHSFMIDLESDLDYQKIVKKWYKKPSLKLLFNKYVWGNRQKVKSWERKNKRI